VRERVQIALFQPFQRSRFTQPFERFYSQKKNNPSPDFLFRKSTSPLKGEEI
jgi:hypothetical protein